MDSLWLWLWLRWNSFYFNNTPPLSLFQQYIISQQYLYGLFTLSNIFLCTHTHPFCVMCICMRLIQQYLSWLIIIINPLLHYCVFYCCSIYIIFSSKKITFVCSTITTSMRWNNSAEEERESMQVSVCEYMNDYNKLGWWGVRSTALAVLLLRSRWFLWTLNLNGERWTDGTGVNVKCYCSSLFTYYKRVYILICVDGK